MTKYLEKVAPWAFSIALIILGAGMAGGWWAAGIASLGIGVTILICKQIF